MKHLRPGQVCMIKGKPFRAKARTLGCNGCALNNFLQCPNVVFANESRPIEIHCDIDNIIFTPIPIRYTNGYR